MLRRRHRINDTPADTTREQGRSLTQCSSIHHGEHRRLIVAEGLQSPEEGRGKRGVFGVTWRIHHSAFVYPDPYCVPTKEVDGATPKFCRVSGGGGGGGLRGGTRFTRIVVDTPALIQSMQQQLDQLRESAPRPLTQTQTQLMCSPPHDPPGRLTTHIIYSLWHFMKKHYI